jgi:hypothetical protein
MPLDEPLEPACAADPSFGSEPTLAIGRNDAVMPANGLEVRRVRRE